MNIMNTPSSLYDPRPAPRLQSPPAADPIHWTAGDLAALAVLCAPVYVLAGWAWAIDSMLGWWVTGAGIVVTVESWFSALSFLHRHPDTQRPGRWLVFLAALVPWVLSLGCGAALMIGLFRLSDWLR